MDKKHQAGKFTPNGESDLLTKMGGAGSAEAAETCEQEVNLNAKQDPQTAHRRYSSDFTPAQKQLSGHVTCCLESRDLLPTAEGSVDANQGLTS